MGDGGVGPGVGDEVGAGEVGHGNAEAGGQAVLGHAGEGVAVLELGVDDAQSVVRVALARVDNPACMQNSKRFVYSKKNGIAHQRRFASNSPPHNESTTPPPKRDDSPKYRSGTAIMKAKMAEMHMKRHMPQIYLSK